MGQKKISDEQVAAIVAKDPLDAAEGVAWHIQHHPDMMPTIADERKLKIKMETKEISRIDEL